MPRKIVSGEGVFVAPVSLIEGADRSADLHRTAVTVIYPTDTTGEQLAMILRETGVLTAAYDALDDSEESPAE